jgi:hypothetical protein
MLLAAFIEILYKKDNCKELTRDKENRESEKGSSANLKRTIAS